MIMLRPVKKSINSKRLIHGFQRKSKRPQTATRLFTLADNHTTANYRAIDLTMKHVSEGVTTKSMVSTAV